MLSYSHKLEVFATIENVFDVPPEV